MLDRSKLAGYVREISKPRPWRVVGDIAFQYVLITVTIATAVYSHHWLVYAVAIFIIGTRQHALAVIGHDGSHFRLFSQKWLNNTISDFFCFFPIGVSTSAFRQFHFEHHSFVNTEKDSEVQFMKGDEDWVFPKLPIQCVRLLAEDLVGLNTPYITRLIWWWSSWPRLIPQKKHRWTISAGERFRLLVFAATIGTVLTLSHTWFYFLVLWIVPTLTALVFINRIRSLAEHFGVEKDHELNESRHVNAGWIERFIFCPFYVNYHLEHHLFPSVPYFALPTLHRKLMEDETFRTHAHITESYINWHHGVLAEVTTKHPPFKAAAA